MLILTIIRVAFKSLLASKLRSMLAMLGIIIGVGAVISMLALGNGAQKQVMERMSAMGTNLLIVRPGNRGSGGVMSGTQQNLTLEDAAALVQIEGVDSVAPVVSGSVQAKFLNKNERASVIGSSPTYLQIRNFEVEKGRAFSALEAERNARVAVLGPTTAENLFGPDDPLDQVVKMNGINFRVVGVLKAKGDQGWFNPDDQVIMPYSTAMKQVFGVDKLREIDIQAFEGANLDAIIAAAGSILRKHHRLLADAGDDFNVRNQAEIQEAVSSFQQTFTYLLAGIASISLLVGGIGIMNIMLVTVTERTREIGVRKAIGAKDRDILAQFLVESVVMSGLGGMLGVAAGIGGAAVLAKLMGMATIVEPASVVLSLSFACGVGIFFGFYPALRAARLNPIEALRYE